MEEALSEVVFTKRSDAEDEAFKANGKISPVYDTEGNRTGYKVFARAELTISEKLRGVVKGSTAPGGPSDVSAGVVFGDTIEATKGMRGPIDYEQITAMIPEEYQIGSGSLSYQQERGDQDFESKELRGQYSLPIGEATVGVHGGVREEERNIVPEQVQRFFQNLMQRQRTQNVGASVQGPIGGGIGSLNVNRMWGDMASPQSRFQDTRPTSDIQPVNRVGAQFQMPLGAGEVAISGDYWRNAYSDRPHWNIGAQLRYPFPR